MPETPAVRGSNSSLMSARCWSRLDQLLPDERSDQIADWAVYGTLLQSGLSSDAVRQANFIRSLFAFQVLRRSLTSTTAVAGEFFSRKAQSGCFIQSGTCKRRQRWHVSRIK